MPHASLLSQSHGQRSMANSSQMMSPASWLGSDVKTYAYSPHFLSNIVLQAAQVEA